jgi:hypothetical protein
MNEPPLFMELLSFARRLGMLFLTLPGFENGSLGTRLVSVPVSVYLDDIFDCCYRVLPIVFVAGTRLFMGGSFPVVDA